MKKSELYLQIVDRIIDEHINVTELNSDDIVKAIQAAIEWHKNQQIMKRPPLNSRSLNYYVYLSACESWLEYLLSSDKQNLFQSYQDLERFIYQFLSQIGWKTQIVGYDSIIVALMAKYASLLKEWLNK